MDEYFIYSRIREEASKENKNLSSRGKAAKALEISQMSLNNYETGVTVPYPKVVAKMAEVYDAPELKYYYCRNICEMKPSFVPDVNTDSEEIDVERLTLRLLKSLKDIPSMKERLVDIAEDGIISDDEKEPFQKILEELNVIVKHASELQMWAEKILKL